MGLRSTLTTLLRDVDRLRAEAIGVRPVETGAMRGTRSGGNGLPAAVELRAIVPRPGGNRADRPASTDGASPTTVGARTVVIEDVVRETDDAVSLVLRDRSGAPFTFAPGQFLTLILDVRGERLRRSYSISSSADEARSATITIKRVSGGKVSGHLVEHARPGQALEVFGPAGTFTPSPAGTPRRLVLIAGGSGITPMMSIARTVLAREPGVRVDLVYGNRGERDIIFREALDALAHQHAPRFVIRHVLGEILDRTVAARELDALAVGSAPQAMDTEYFLCGPEPMMREIRAVLGGRAAPTAVREERFTPGETRLAAPQNGRPMTDARTVRLRVRRDPDSHVDVRIATDVSILRAALAAGVDLPYSCTEGICGACRVRAADPAAVHMAAGHCLSFAETTAGYVLTCVSRARADVELRVE